MIAIRVHIVRTAVAGFGKENNFWMAKTGVNSVIAKLVCAFVLQTFNWTNTGLMVCILTIFNLFSAKHLAERGHEERRKERCVLTNFH